VQPAPSREIACEPGPRSVAVDQRGIVVTPPRRAAAEWIVCISIFVGYKTKPQALTAIFPPLAALPLRLRRIRGRALPLDSLNNLTSRNSKRRIAHETLQLFPPALSSRPITMCASKRWARFRGSPIPIDRLA